MDQNQVVTYIFYGVMVAPVIGTGALLIAEAMPILLQAGLAEIARLRYPEKINSQEDLDRIVKEEARKLGIKKQFKAIYENDAITTSDIFGVYGGVAQRISDGTYEIRIGGYGRNRATVRHELYHIYRGHCDDCIKKSKNPLLNHIDRNFRREIQACVYQAFGLKL